MADNIMFVVQKISDGGAERVVSVLASQLAEMGKKVSVLVYFPTKNEYSLDARVNKIYLTSTEEEYRNLSFTKKIILIRKRLKQVDADYYIPFLYFVGIHVQLAAWGLKGTIILTVRNDPSSMPPQKSHRWMRDQQIKFSKCTIVQNKTQLEYFPQSWKRKIKIMPNPVNEQFFQQKFTPPQDRFSVVAVGRLNKQKNFSMLIRAFEQFALNHRDVALNIYGDGELKKCLQMQIKESGLENIVSLCGRSNEIPAVLAASSVFVMSSNFEGMPNSLMEAMAVGIPVISTDCPTGPKELIGDNDRGMLVPPEDETALTQALEEIYRNYDKWKSKGNRAAQYIKDHYRQREIAKQLLEICSEGEIKG